MCIPLHDRCRHTYVFCESSIDQGILQPLAEVWSITFAEEAITAWCRICCHNPHARFKTIYTFSNFFNCTCVLVSKQSGDILDEQWMASFVCLNIGTASERSSHLNQQLTWSYIGNISFLESHITDSVVHCSLHSTGHLYTSGQPMRRAFKSLPD